MVSMIFINDNNNIPELEKNSKNRKISCETHVERANSLCKG